MAKAHHSDAPNQPHSEKALTARIAASERWGRKVDRTAASAPAWEGLFARFLREVDPDGVLPAHERQQRAEQLRYAHMLRMSRAAAAARRKRRA